MDNVIKKVVIGEKEFLLREPAGYEVDRLLTLYYDDNMNPIKDKIAEANVHIIKMFYGLSEDEIKKLPNRVYRKLLNEALAYFKEMNQDTEGAEKK